ncbi:MAG: hypothetical protein WD846_00745 [Patescibacteria group bacterium]
MHLYTPAPGEHVGGTAEVMVSLADERDEHVIAQFNGIWLKAKPGATLTVGRRTLAIGAYYQRVCDRRHREYMRSPEGRAALREQEEFRKQAAAAKAEGIKPFRVKDEDGWQKAIEANQDGYGAAVVRYAARWANLMESKMANGAELGDIARDTSHEADLEGITGFQYGCAVSILAQVWEHGEQLRRWHNSDTQIGDEGDRANENGGVLNPAILRGS